MTDASAQDFRIDNATPQGITVIELGQFIAGLMAGQQLADFGARVIKDRTAGSWGPVPDL